MHVDVAIEHVVNCDDRSSEAQGDQRLRTEKLAIRLLLVVLLLAMVPSSSCS